MPQKRQGGNKTELPQRSRVLGFAHPCFNPHDRPQGIAWTIPTAFAVGRPPRYFDLSFGHAPAQGCRSGSDADHVIISRGFLASSFPIFCSLGSGLISLCVPRPQIATGGHVFFCQGSKFGFRGYLPTIFLVWLLWQKCYNVVMTRFPAARLSEISIYPAEVCSKSIRRPISNDAVSRDLYRKKV